MKTLNLRLWTVLSLLALTLFSLQVFSQGIDVSVTSTSTYDENEISLAVMPGDSMLAGYNTGANNPMGVALSTDGGATWTNSTITPPVGLGRVFDPTVGYDNLGNRFYGNIATTGALGAPSSLVCNVSGDGGSTWSITTVSSDPGANAQICNPGFGFPCPNPFPLPNPCNSGVSCDPDYRFNDRCQLAVDLDPSSTYANNVYFTWIKDRGLSTTNLNSDVYFAYSSDAGSTFSLASSTLPPPLPPAPSWAGRINDAGNDFANVPIPSVASDGSIYVVWLNFDVANRPLGGTGTIYLDHSVDGGATFGNDLSVVSFAVPRLYLNGGAGPNAQGKSFGGLTMATSPTNPGEVYIVYTVDPAGADETDLLFTSTTDSGNTWSTPLSITDEAVSDTNDQHLAWMEVRPDGTIDVVWQDRRNDPNDLNWDVYHTSSTDGGATWSTNVQINDNSFATPSGGNTNGEYLGMASDANGVYAMWSANQGSGNPNGDLQFDKIVSCTPSTPGPLGSLLEVSIEDPLSITNDRFGEGIALSQDGNTLVVGVNSEDVLGGRADLGTAYVYERNACGPNSWSRVARLEPAARGVLDRYGHDVEISEDGSTIVVTGFLEDSLAGGTCLGTCDDPGAVYVYVRPGASSWSSSITLTENAKLVASNPMFHGYLGYDVAISENTIAASHGIGNSNFPDWVYMYEMPSGGWGSMASPSTLTENARLTNSNNAFSQSFASSVSMRNNIVVVGAPGENVARGAAYLFERPSSGSWGSSASPPTINEDAKLLGGFIYLDAHFGHNVGIDGDYVVVGAPFDDSVTNNSGAVYVFKKPAGGWSGTVNEEWYSKSNPDSLNVEELLFGISTGIRGTNVIIGALNADNYEGAAFLYSRSDSGWHRQPKIKELPNATGFAGFGGEVAISGQRYIGGNIDVALAITSPFYNGNKGKVFMYAHPVTFQDGDGDGIEDNVDTQASTYSNDFSDVHLSGKTEGEITTRANRTWTVFDEGAPWGIHILATTDTVVGVVSTTGCTPSVVVNVPANQTGNFTITCGSVTIAAHDAEVKAVASEGAITVSADVDSGNAITFLSLDPDSMEIEADPNNVSYITLTFNGQTILLAPGQLDTLTFGDCMTVELPECLVISPDYEACIDLSPTISGGVPPYSFLWSTGDIIQDINVCPDSMTTYSLTVTDSDTCETTVDVNVNVVSAACGKNDKKLLVCHKPGISARPLALCVSANAVSAHLRNHDDYLGECFGDPCATQGGNKTSGSIQLYPNPNQGQFTIDINDIEAKQVQLRLYNVNGQLIKTEDYDILNGNLKRVMSLDDQKYGVYYLRIVSNKLLYTLKLVYME